MHLNTIEQFGMVFSKNINNLQSWTELFFSEKTPLPPEKTPLPPSQCCWQSYRLLATKLGQIQH